MEAFVAILQWWRTLSVVAKVVCVVASVAVVVGLGVGMYQVYSAPPARWSATQSSQETATAKPPNRGLLSLPLPGTGRRKEAEITQRLEAVLGDYDYITSAQAVFAVALPEAKSPAPPRLTLHLHLSPTTTPPAEWIQNLVGFVLHTVAGLERADLLITDGRGVPLFSEGRPTADSVLVERSDSASVPLRSSRAIPEWLLGLGGAGIVILLAVGAYLRLRASAYPEGESAGTEESESTGDQQPAPLEFLGDLSADQIVALLEGERQQVAALALERVPDEQNAQEVREVLGLVEGIVVEPLRPAHNEILLSLGEALRAKYAQAESSTDTREY